MSNADMFVEMIRLAEQIGTVEDAHMYPNNYLSIAGETKDGKKFNLSLSLRGENEDAEELE
jgi:hypothetical protein